MLLYHIRAGLSRENRFVFALHGGDLRVNVWHVVKFVGMFDTVRAFEKLERRGAACLGYVVGVSLTGQINGSAAFVTVDGIRDGDGVPLVVDLDGV